ncbi:MAG: methyltransferase domain-containing protein [Candidatus Omnitrophota bacterium]
MNIHFNKILTCPYDRGNVLLLKSFEEKDKEVFRGVLICPACQRWYPIVEAIPIILPDRLRNSPLDNQFRDEYSGLVVGGLEPFDNRFTKEYIFEPLNYPYRFEATPRVSRLIREKSFGLSLDAGCGTGAYFADFQGGVVGLDLTFDLLKRAKAAHPKKQNLHLIMADIACPPFKERSFNFILCSQTLEHLEEEEISPTLKQFDRICRGEILVDVPNHSRITNFLRDIFYPGWREGELDNKLLLHHSEWDSRRLAAFGFKVFGGLGFVSMSRIKNRFLAGFLDWLIFKLPFLSGTLIGLKSKWSP